MLCRALLLCHVGPHEWSILLQQPFAMQPLSQQSLPLPQVDGRAHTASPARAASDEGRAELPPVPPARLLRHA